MQVSCEVIRESISAALDEERSDLPRQEADRHLAGCDACRAWQEAAHEITRQFRLQIAEDPVPVPAGLRAALVGTDTRRRPSPVVVVRVALAAMGVAQLLASGRLLLSGEIDRFRDLGALEVALAVGYLVAALRPRRAAGTRAIAGTAALLLLASAAVDLVHHRTTVSDEAPHLIALAGWLLIVVLARRTPEFGAPPSAVRRWVTDHRWSEVPAAGRRATGWGDAPPDGSSVWARATGTELGDAGTTTGVQGATGGMDAQDALTARSADAEAV